MKLQVRPLYARLVGWEMCPFPMLSSGFLRMWLSSKDLDVDLESCALLRLAFDMLRLALHGRKGDTFDLDVEPAWTIEVEASIVVDLACRR